MKKKKYVKKPWIPNEYAWVKSLSSQLLWKGLKGIITFVKICFKVPAKFSYAVLK